jgi:hypothetical protein
VAASIPAPDHDDCGNEHPADDAPCSGASDGCRCACCPLPVLGGTEIPLGSAAPTLPLRAPALAACSSRTGSPPDHPPK